MEQILRQALNDIMMMQSLTDPKQRRVLFSLFVYFSHLHVYMLHSLLQLMISG